jgi:quinol monooxygenase YgiN
MFILNNSVSASWLSKLKFWSRNVESAELKEAKTDEVEPEVSETTEEPVKKKVHKLDIGKNNINYVKQLIERVEKAGLYKEIVLVSYVVLGEDQQDIYKEIMQQNKLAYKNAFVKTSVIFDSLGHENEKVWVQKFATREQFKYYLKTDLIKNIYNTLPVFDTFKETEIYGPIVTDAMMHDIEECELADEDELLNSLVEDYEALDHPKPITMIGHFKVKDKADLDLIQSHLAVIAKRSRDEDGNIDYRFFKDIDHSDTFFIFQNWDDFSDLKKHFKNRNYNLLRKVTTLYGKEALKLSLISYLKP